MFNSTIIEVAIGLVLLYLVLGLIVTSINEFLSQLLSLRSENLADAIYGLFPGEDRFRLAEDILDHSLVNSLSRKQVGVRGGGPEGDAKGSEIAKLPSAIPGSIFAEVVLHLKKNPSLKTAYDEITWRPIEVVLARAGRTAKAQSEALAAWYDEVLARASGWYKRRVQVMSFLVAFAFVLLMNADTLTIVDRLANSPVERARMEAYAKRLQEANLEEGKTLEDLPPELKTASLSFLGWTSRESDDARHAPRSASEAMLKLFGLSLTAFAACLGAPFWFDVLSKVMTVRSGGAGRSKEPEKKGEEGGSGKTGK